MQYDRNGIGSKIIGVIERPKKPVYVRKYIIGICLVLMLFITIQSALSLDWHEQRRIAKEISRSLNYEGELRFAYYVTKDNVLADYMTYDNKPKHSLITFYKGCEDYSKEDFKCIVLHELGHYNDIVVKHTPIISDAYTPLSEAYANLFMFEKNPNCTMRWSE